MQKQEIVTVVERPVKSDDDALLESLGYKQEFMREFTPLELFGVMFSILGPVPSFGSVLVYAIPNGGPVAMVWGWIICSFFLVVISLAMAELGSAAPTSGGLYYWTYSLSSPRWKCLLCWIVGYANTTSLIAGYASGTWACAVQLMAAVSIGYDQKFVPTNTQTYGVYCAMLLVTGVLSSTATRYIARIQSLYIALNILCFIAVIVVLPAVTPVELRNSASFAFGNFQNLTSWTPGFAFVMSFLAPLWAVGIGGFDNPVHISEEASNASTAVPWAIILGTGIPAILGWVLNLVVVFCMGSDLEGIAASPIGQPLAVIFLNSLGKPGALALWSIVVILQFTICLDALTVTSRQSFAFSRDGALPFSSYLYRLNSRTQTPIICVWFDVFIAALLGLLSFAGSTAIGAVFTLPVAASYVAYSIPISARWLGGREWKAGPFCLGSFGFPIAVTSVLFMFFAYIVFMFPVNPHPTAVDMNYTSVMLGAVLGGAFLSYYFPVYGGVYWFQGPVANISALKKVDEVINEKGHGEQISKI